MKKRMREQNIDDEWRNIIDKLSKLPCNNNIRSVVRKMVLSTFVYHIWRERNVILFTTEKKGCAVVIKDIEDSVKLQLLSIQVKNSVQVRAMAEQWEIQMKIHN